MGLNHTLYIQYMWVDNKDTYILYIKVLVIHGSDYMHNIIQVQYLQIIEKHLLNQ